MNRKKKSVARNKFTTTQPMHYAGCSVKTKSQKSLFAWLLFRIPTFARRYHYQIFEPDVVFSTLHLYIDVGDPINTYFLIQCHTRTPYLLY